VNGCIDIHCHILPGVDDGPQTLPDAIALCRVLAREGIETVVATPHMLGRYEGTNSAGAIRRAVAELQAALERFRIKLNILPGGEVRLDERIPRLVEEDQVLTVADNRKYLLLELPTGIEFEASAVLARVAVPGVRVVLAHAERYEFLHNTDAARKWTDAGAIIQVNTSSLAGGWSPGAQRAGWELIEAGIARVVGSDAHSVGQRSPRWQQAIAMMIQRIGEPATRKLAIENPQRIIAGQDLE